MEQRDAPYKLAEFVDMDESHFGAKKLTFPTLPGSLSSIFSPV